MGSFTTLYVDGYSLVDSKSAVIPEIMTVFRESDRQTSEEPVEDGEPEETENIVQYVSDREKIIDRLNVMGFTLSRARADYEAARLSEIQQYEEETDWTPEDLGIMKVLDFDTFMASFGTIMSKKIYGYAKEKQEPDAVAQYILKQHDEYLFGYYCKDFRLLLRMACEVAPEGCAVVQDISELVSVGCYGENEPVCENATRELIASHPENSSRIILTEGSNDVHVLKAGLELLYPHLVGYYSFLDFDLSRSPGGAGHLVSLVKAFAGAGITNRTVALFDNDTAAHEAAQQLRTVPMPPNILVLHYPDLPLLRSYPTLGPGGLVLLDVNGLAGSVELYFGKDILQEGKGTLTPVQWRGYSETMKKYQGEVTQKSRLLTAYNARVARCRQDAAAIAEADWSGIDAILQKIFHAFD